MRAVVLVGGFGTRLRPLTFTTPKPMLAVGHRPILENLIRMLAGAGIEEVVLALGFKPEPFTSAFPDAMCAGVHLRYTVEPEPLDTAGAIRFAADEADIDETFIVVNGDVLTDLDVTTLISFHRHCGAEATIHLTPVDDPSAYGVVVIDDDGRVKNFIEKPALGTAPSNLINAGTYVLEPAVLQRIQPGRKMSIEREIFPIIAQEGNLFAMPTVDYWIDAGRPKTYLQANMDMINGARRGLSAMPIESGATIDLTAIVQNSLVSRGATVAAHVIVSDSVILPGAKVDQGASVRRSVVMGHVGAGASIEDSLVGASGHVAVGASLSHVFLPDPSAV